MLGFQSFSQISPGLAGSREQYLKKSKNQNTVGWVLLAGGTAMAVVGAVGFGRNFELFDDTNDRKADLYGKVVVAGIAADLISIPFFIASGKNARRAARVDVSSIRRLEQRGNSIYYTQLAVLSVKIPF